MSTAVTMPALPRVLLLRNPDSPLPAPLATTFSGAPLPCQMEVCFVAQLEPTCSLTHINTNTNAHARATTQKHNTQTLTDTSHTEEIHTQASNDTCKGNGAATNHQAKSKNKTKSDQITPRRPTPNQPHKHLSTNKLNRCTQTLCKSPFISRIMRMPAKRGHHVAERLYASDLPTCFFSALVPCLGC